MAIVEQWPSHMLRSVSSSVILGSLNMSAQPLFLAAPAVFADPMDQRWLATLNSPLLVGKESTVGGKFRPSYREVEGRIVRLKGMNGRLRIHDPLYVRPQYDTALIESNWSDGRGISDGRRWAAGLLPPSVTVDAIAYE